MAALPPLLLLLLSIVHPGAAQTPDIIVDPPMWSDYQDLFAVNYDYTASPSDADGPIGDRNLLPPATANHSAPDPEDLIIRADDKDEESDSERWWRLDQEERKREEEARRKKEEEEEKALKESRHRRHQKPDDKGDVVVNKTEKDLKTLIITVPSSGNSPSGYEKVDEPSHVEIRRQEEERERARREEEDRRREEKRIQDEMKRAQDEKREKEEREKRLMDSDSPVGAGQDDPDGAGKAERKEGEASKSRSGRKVRWGKRDDGSNTLIVTVPSTGNSPSTPIQEPSYRELQEKEQERERRQKEEEQRKRAEEEKREKERRKDSDFADGLGRDDPDGVTEAQKENQTSKTDKKPGLLERLRKKNEAKKKEKRVESPPEQALVDILTGDSANIGKNPSIHQTGDHRYRPDPNKPKNDDDGNDDDDDSQQEVARIQDAMWGDDGNFSSLMTLDGLDEDDEFYEFRNLTKELAAAEKEEEEELLTSAANSDWGLVWPAAVYPPNETKPWPNEMMSDEPSQNNPPPPHPPNQHAKPTITDDHMGLMPQPPTQDQLPTSTPPPPPYQHPTIPPDCVSEGAYTYISDALTECNIFRQENYGELRRVRLQLFACDNKVVILAAVTTLLSVLSLCLSVSLMITNARALAAKGALAPKGNLPPPPPERGMEIEMGTMPRSTSTSVRPPTPHQRTLRRTQAQQPLARPQEYEQLGEDVRRQEEEKKANDSDEVAFAIGGRNRASDSDSSI